MIELLLRIVEDSDAYLLRPPLTVRMSALHGPCLFAEEFRAEDDPIWQREGEFRLDLIHTIEPLLVSADLEPPA